MCLLWYNNHIDDISGAATAGKSAASDSGFAYVLMLVITVTSSNDTNVSNDINVTNDTNVCV